MANIRASSPKEGWVLGPHLRTGDAESWRLDQTEAAFSHWISFSFTELSKIHEPRELSLCKVWTFSFHH